ncbi:MAG: ABC transporter permease [Rhodocyclales bacterium RIFCSPLOWO2_02_FULL_63_24]|nr:MAG: ABC transporter permease [Rhodocyclales bacterium GWA2_65_19]OHC69111.1 MAG: ABC transporter permease [Rhodocyclales bacterium RIFCSPLOWO2_02_FULL_63_24]
MVIVSSSWRLALRMLARDWRTGELTVLGIALMLAVAALTSVGFLTDRVEQALKLESHQLLGGDLLLTADHPWPDGYRREAAARGLRQAESATFPSMVSLGEAAMLAEIKAVSKGYPLRGALRTAPVLNAVDAENPHVPEAGEAWPDERLATTLSLVPGTSLALGRMTVVSGPVLTLEPDRGMNVFALAPRLMINLADLPATGLVQNGSRVSYRLHLAGEAAAVAAFEVWAKTRLGRGEKIESLDNARPEVRNVTERAQRFLRLAALLAVILAAVAVALAAERYMRRHLDGCAVMRCMGASGSQLLLIHGGEFLVFGLLATLAGCAVGYAVQAALQQLLAGVLVTQLPAPSLLPWLHGLLVGLTLVVGFALPPLLRLKRVPTIRVLRREWSGSEPASVGAYLLGALVLAALMLWMAGELRLGAIVLAGFMIALGFFAVTARLLLAGLGRLRPAGRGYGWRHGLANLRRRLAATLVQAVALALGLTALLLLTVARGDLLDSWLARVPADAPNRFAINIQPDQRVAIADFFKARGLAAPELEPMVRGRLVQVNAQPVGPESYADDRAQRLVDREFNLSWSARLPTGNTVSGGRWHGTAQSAEFSVEQGLAETLNLKLGDRLAYDIAGNRVEAVITSLRKLDWDSMRVNFFVMAPPGVLNDFPLSYITSFYLPAGKEGTIPELVRAFPNLTVIDVAAVVRQLHATIDQVARAVQLVFGFAVLAGLAVLYAALQASSDERRHELAVLRALGARSRQLSSALLAEFAALGALAGLLAGIAASLIGWGLARFAFRLDYLPQPALWGIGLAAGTLLVVVAGWLGASSMLRQSALPALRAAQ